MKTIILLFFLVGVGYSQVDSIWYNLDNNGELVKNVILSDSTFIFYTEDYVCVVQKGCWELVDGGITYIKFCGQQYYNRFRGRVY